MGNDSQLARQPRYGRVARQIWWTSVPIWSIGFLSFVPFLAYALIQRGKKDWAVFAAYLAATVAVIVALDTVNSDDAVGAPWGAARPGWLRPLPAEAVAGGRPRAARRPLPGWRRPSRGWRRPSRENGRVLLSEIAEVSRTVATTSARLAKIETLAGALRAAGPLEVPIAVAYLSGELPQRQIGVGWAALRGVSGGGPPGQHRGTDSRPRTRRRSPCLTWTRASPRSGRCPGRVRRPRARRWSASCSAGPPRASSGSFTGSCPASCGRVRWRE